MNDSDILRAEIRAHAEALHTAYSAWPGTGEDPGALAWAIMEHAWMLHRYTRDEAIAQHLISLPAPERRALAVAACGALDTTRLQARLASLTRTRDWDESDSTALEHALLRRDVLGVTMDGIGRVAHDLRLAGPVGDRELLDRLADAQVQLDALDEAFAGLREATLACMPILDGVKAAVPQPTPPHHWWLRDGPAILAMEESALLSPGLHAREGTAMRSTRGDVIEFLDRALGRKADGTPRHDYQLAAADGTGTVERLLQGGESPQHLSIRLDEGAYLFRIYDPQGRSPDGAALLRLVLEGEDGGRAEWAFDARGEARVDSFPAGPGRALRVEHADTGHCVGTLRVDD